MKDWKVVMSGSSRKGFKVLEDFVCEGLGGEERVEVEGYRVYAVTFQFPSTFPSQQLLTSLSVATVIITLYSGYYIKYPLYKYHFCKPAPLTCILNLMDSYNSTNQ